MTDFGKRPGHLYVDRGDPPNFDWSLSDLITDGTLRHIDASSILPSGAIAACFRFFIQDDLVGAKVSLRIYGNVHATCIHELKIRISNISEECFALLPCASDRKFSYWSTNTTFTSIYIVITGWFI